MKKIFCFLMITIATTTIVTAQEKGKTSSLELKAAQIAKEQTEKDVKQYNLTPAQREEMYKANLELARQKAALGDRASDRKVQLEQEQMHFKKLSPILKPAQMSKLVKDHQKAMEAFRQD